MSEGKTAVGIAGEDWLIDGRQIYAGRRWRGRRIEELLLNARLANGIFDDLNPLTRHLWAYPDTGAWDPERNISELIAALPSYRRHGLVAIGLNLQGASPLGYYRSDRDSLDSLMNRIRAAHPEAAPEAVWRGLRSSSQPWDSGAFDPDGALRPAFMARAARVIESAAGLGMVVCLGLFYFGQDERLAHEAAVLAALDGACRWVLDGGYVNVVIEIANEADVPLYEHDILTAARVHELVSRARSIGDGRLLVGTSFCRAAPTPEVVEASDFILLHGNFLHGSDAVTARIAEVRALPAYRGQPIVFNEDDHFDFNRPRNNFAAALEGHAGWGFFDPGAGAGGAAAWGDYADGFQSPPIDWRIGTTRKRAFFATLQAVTGGAGVRFDTAPAPRPNR